MKNSIRKKRMSMGMTQTELAKRIELSRPYLSEVEKGKRIPSTEIAIKIARVLDSTVESIFLQDLSYKLNNSDNKKYENEKEGVN